MSILLFLCDLCLPCSFGFSFFILSQIFYCDLHFCWRGFDPSVTYICLGEILLLSYFSFCDLHLFKGFCHSLVSSVTYIRLGGILLLDHFSSCDLYPFKGFCHSLASLVTYFRLGRILLLSRFSSCDLHPFKGFCHSLASSVTYIRLGGILLIGPFSFFFLFFFWLFKLLGLLALNHWLNSPFIAFKNDTIFGYIYWWYFFKCSMFHGRGSFCPSKVSR